MLTMAAKTEWLMTIKTTAKLYSIKLQTKFKGLCFLQLQGLLSSPSQGPH